MTTMIKYSIEREGGPLNKWIVRRGDVAIRTFDTRDEARAFAGQKPSHAKKPHRATPSKQQDDDARTGG